MAITTRAGAPVAFRDRVRAHVALAKLRIIELLLATALPTAFLAADGLPPLGPTLAILVGGTLAAASANTLNSVYDRDIDAKMARTFHRPAVKGTVSASAGVAQGIILALLSASVLLIFANTLASALALIAIGFYAVVYTMMLKRRTPQNIVWGGAAGCMPVLIAWAAVTGSLAWTPVVLFLIVFLWTPPHYWPLAMRFKDDYAAAGVPMLPVVASPRTVTRNILAYSWAMVAVSLVLVPVGGMGWVYTVGAVALGGMFLWSAYALWRRVDTAEAGRAAMRLFHGSITYLALLFALVAVDPFLH